MQIFKDLFNTPTTMHPSKLATKKYDKRVKKKKTYCVLLPNYLNWGRRLKASDNFLIALGGGGEIKELDNYNKYHGPFKVTQRNMT